MAKHTDVYYTDDLTGERITTDVEHVTFGLDGVTYEIDLSPESAENLRTSLAEYVAAGRKVSTAGKPARKPSATKAATTPGDKTDIRAWAVSKGMKVADRGRIPLNVMEAYEAEHKETTVVEETAPVVEDVTVDDGKPWVEENTPEPTDEQIIAWAQAKGLRTPKNGKPSGPLKDKYLADRQRSSGRGNVVSLNRGA